MTAFNARSNGRLPKSRNKKDGATGRRRPSDRTEEFERAGFTLLEPPSKFFYAWQGVYPVFQVKPGIINGLAGIVARCETADVYEWFPYGTDPQVIRERINQLIPEIMQKQAEDNEAIDWIDFDEFMLEGN